MFSRILRRQNKKNEAAPATPKVQSNEESQVQQGSTDSTKVHSSIKRSAQEDSATPPAKIARFEMATSSSRTWELPAGLADYIDRYMSHHVTDKKVKEKILTENPVPSNIKGTSILDNCIKEILLKNMRSPGSPHGYPRQSESCVWPTFTALGHHARRERSRSSRVK